MSADDQSKEPEHPKIDLRKLPKIVSIECFKRRYKSPRIYYNGRERCSAHQAIEIVVETETPIPARAVTPMLVIGRARISEYTTIKNRTYRFYAFDLDAIKQGDAVSLGWPDEPQTPVEATGHYVRFANPTFDPEASD